ncbi:glutamate-5-semialdehyde dehydrogenase [Streptomyces sp. ISL-11]|uniref:glutamate-5-semialdehyde dehydrogenase n=1 Tax=Streptomyces sp. ISL-11 TaxID=2819174 RepID=UPI001BE607A3|nr:glutamate-5-semialdehyde dehydrogenase [Streptomyces sp. ISL-11]MBT2383364.1 glutamate-5-semialdehyde dehydrogenase [Streptomyces sp. ISL-11]
MPPSVEEAAEETVRAARTASETAPPVGDPAYQRYCRTLAERLREDWPAILKANAEDVGAATSRGLPATIVDRLRLTDDHLEVLERLAGAVHDALPAATAKGPETPVGEWGVRRQVPKPLGVVLMVYEARPTVTVEGALLSVGTGNAVLLRGGKEIAATNTALAATLRAAAERAGLPAGMATVLDDPKRAQLRWLLAHPDAVDVLIPRGSPSLIDYCRTATSIPVIASGGGVNHLYVHRSADLERAAAIALDSKVGEPTACNTLELALVDSCVAEEFTARLAEAAQRERHPTTLRVDPGLGPVAAGDMVRVQPLEEHDLGREFLDRAVGVLAVDGLDEAVRHIRRYGSGHTEGVVAEDRGTLDAFVARVDAATLVTNGSLRLHDGPTMGLGPELSISTGRLHVRGPVTLGDLLTRSWLISARGTLRDAPR